MLVDDPHKGRAEAESSARREDVWEWFNDDALSRLEPHGSCIVTQTRWHTDDLAGRLIAKGWEVINLPAIDDQGKALWPERYPVDRLLEIQAAVGEYTWASLYQGQPRPRGASVFRDAHYYSELPKHSFSVCIGVDLAYTARTYSDHSVAVVMLECEGRFYVVDVVRRQVEAPRFAEVLGELQQQHGQPRTVGYLGGTEIGVADFMVSQGVDFEALPARADKFVRAQPVAAAWNAGKILLPNTSPPWLEAFLAEVCGFTGVRDAHDDQVDALAGAFDGLAGGTSDLSIATVGGRYS
jgi:predicted phage terminase large subunit-like protein